MRKFWLVALVMGLVPFGIAGVSKAASVGPMTYVPVPTDFHFPDGPTTEIAVREYFPDGFVDGSHNWPALVEIEGYGGASAPNDNSFVNDHKDYVVVAISIRGTGCSQGVLDLFSQQSAADGAWIIDHWIPNRAWSNGDVGIYGHSYGGLMGFLTAEEAPTHLRAVAVSGLIDDFYRGILYPGGISNYGFPVLWGAGVRPLGEHSGNGSFYVSDSHCAQNFATHEGSDVAPPPSIVADTYGSPLAKDPVTGDPTWGITHALLARIKNINVPIQLGQQYQDEQTGPRGGHVLWENLPNVPKRITISTGQHNPNDPTRNKKAWLDCWIINHGNLASSSHTTPAQSCADVLDPNQRVRLYFESKKEDRLAPYITSDWPLPASEVDYRHYYLGANGTLSQTQGPDGSTTYVSTPTGRHLTGDLGAPNGVTTGAPLGQVGYTSGLPDTARFTLDFTQKTALAGPIDLTLYASLTSADVDFWAEILDKDTATGATSFVQRGLLRASMAATFVDSLSQKTPAGDIYRPYYRYDGITPIIPGAVNKYEVEVFPLGHVWRPGHQLVLQLHAPPANDPISTYAYEPNSASVVTVFSNSSIMLPFMTTLPPDRGATAPACGSVIGEVCVTPALG